MGILRSSETLFLKIRLLHFQPFMRSKRTTLKSVRPSKRTETPFSPLLQHTMTVRRVDLPQILSHDLTAVSLAIFDVSSQLRTGNKPVMTEDLSSGTERPWVMPVAGRSMLVVDGQALVMVIGKPSECHTFDDLGDKFVKALLASGKDFHRKDVTFDRYRETSRLSARLERSSRGHAPIRRVIKDCLVPLPKSSSNFVALDENKADLALFLSHDKLSQEPQWKRSSLLVVDSKRTMQSCVPVRTLISECLKVFMKRRTLKFIYTAYTQMQNSLSSRVKTRMFSSF